MVVKEGYKQTEIGVIPNDWEVKTIVDIISKRNGIKIGPFGSQLKKELLVNRGYKVYGQENVFDKNFEIGNRYLTQEHFEKLKSCNLIFGDFIISMMGTIGKCMIVPENIEKGIMDSHLLRLRLNEKIIKPDLLLHFFSSTFLINQVNKLSVGGIMDGLSSSIVKKIQFGLPNNLAEQTAIATALSDADGLITGLEKLIAKKRNIKQGAMQQLLQPKDGWEVKKLGEISQIYTGKKNNQDKVENGKYPFFVRSKTIETINSYSFDGEAILIPGEGNIGSIFHYINGKFDYHQRVYKISDFDDKYSGKYIYRYISEHFGKHAMQNSVKATVDSLRLPTFQVFEIPFPPSKDEQTRIASILSDMDAELSALEQKLEKYKKVKLGMMQELLTGKTRLV
jgi:type I restriction enzyme S subunit